MKKWFIPAASILFIALLALPFNFLFAAPGLLTNADFETGDFTGWTTYIDPAHLSNNVSIETEGGGTNSYARIDSYSGDSYILQKIPVSSPYISMSLDVRSNFNTFIDSFYIKVELLDDGDNVIASGTLTDTNNYPEWTTLVFNATGLLPALPPGTIAATKAINIFFGVDNSEAHPAITDFDNIILTYQETEEVGSASEEKVWVRDRDMTCFQVWVNDDNNFEFVFWWEYANNNWVKIYDMDGTEAFSIDMKYGNAHFEAPLPDGMYTVKTFHEADKILQEFIIGKQ
jgi:hypothetical protein